MPRKKIVTDSIVIDDQTKLAMSPAQQRAANARLERAEKAKHPVIKTAKTAAPQNRADLLKRFEGYAALNVISRQLDNPGAPGSLPILLTDEDANACVNSDHQWKMKTGAVTCHLCHKPVRYWYVYWGNTSIEGRWSKLKSLGYVPVMISELTDTDDVSDLVKGTGDAYVRRGDSGKEIMVKMPLELHLEIEREQHRRLNGTMNSKKAIRESLAEDAGRELGDEAGQTIFEGGIRMESISRSTRTLSEEMLDDRIDTSQ